MLARLRSWLDKLPFTDPLQQRQASLLQIMIAIILGGCLVGVTISFQTDGRSGVPVRSVITYALIVISAGNALLLLRRGHFTVAVTLTVGGIIVAIGLALVANGLRDASGILLALALPVTLAGLLIGRRGLLFGAGLSIALLVGVAILERVAPTMVGFAEPTPRTAFSLIATFTMLISVLSLFLDRFGNALHQALQMTRAREQELEQLRAALESTVVERTRALQTALAEVEARAEEQARLLAENEQQRAVMREMSVPVIPISAETLIMPLVGALDSERLLLLQAQALQAVERSSARSLILDITGVPIVDNQVAQGLLAVVQATRLLGAETVLVGIRPEVAQTIVGLGLSLDGMRTSSNLLTLLSQPAMN